ncbi:MAG TPA: DUF3159 domain-containing protein [Actinopolymorphaceae bacterium]
MHHRPGHPADGSGTTPDHEPATTAVRPESIATLLGGWKASADATLPPLAFVGALFLSGQSIPWASATAIATSAALGGYRLARGERPRAVLIGLLGVTLAAMIALYTGRAETFFLPRLLSNVASALVWMLSIVLRWPLLGVVVGTILRQGRRWRRDPALLRAYSLASWPWVVQYVVRAVTFGTFYLLGWTAALGIANVVLTWPLIAVNLAASAWIVRRVLPADHPGFRHPRA